MFIGFDDEQMNFRSITLLVCNLRSILMGFDMGLATSIIIRLLSIPAGRRRFKH